MTQRRTNDQSEPPEKWSSFQLLPYIGEITFQYERAVLAYLQLDEAIRGIEQLPDHEFMARLFSAVETIVSAAGMISKIIQPPFNPDETNPKRQLAQQWSVARAKSVKAALGIRRVE